MSGQGDSGPGGGSIRRALAGVYPTDVLLAAVTFCGFFDYPLWTLSWRLGWALLLVSVLLDQEGHLRRRLALTAGLSAASCMAGFALRAASESPAAGGDALYWLWYYRAWPQYLITLWFATRLIEPRSAATAPREVRALSWMLVLLAAWQFSGLTASLDAETSISIYRLDAGNYLVATVALIRLWLEGPRALRVTAAALVAGAAFQVLAAGGVAIRALLADAATLTTMAADGLIGLDDWHRTWRIHYPLKGHNRLGAAMVINFFIFLFGYVRSRDARIAALFAAGAIAAFLLSIASMTRAATLVMVIGLLPLLLGVRGRRLLIIPAALLLALPFVSGTRLAYVRTAVTPSELMRENSSLRMRVRGWHGALLMMREHPWSGIGYGPENFYAVYGERYESRTGDTETKRHAHNVFMETGAESGLPALAFLLALTALRWTLLARALRTSPRDPSLLLWLGFELAMFLFLQFFHMHKRNQGILFQGYWVWSALCWIDAARDGANRVASGSRESDSSAREQIAA